jgi:1-deoxy-D-xylulose-5-phosphate reductoisomerase
MPVRGVVILGSTGSVGRNTLDVIARHPDRYRVLGLSAHRDVERLARQCQAHDVPWAAIADAKLVPQLREALAAVGSKAQVLAGDTGLCELVATDGVDTVMAAIVGAAGLPPTLHAVELGHRLLLANKESMVIAGALFARAQTVSGADIIPVDSEHNALFQALPDGFRAGLEAVGVERLVLTASGGPFLDRDQASLDRVTPDEACAHPNWDMGRKISVDSATLLNKGLEVIEASWLFNARADQIEVLVHPQSIVHSLVAYRDGSMLAQLGQPDMRTPIAHALAWPERIDAGVPRLDLTQCAALEFRQPDLKRFPCLELAFQCLRTGRSAPVVLNAANEIAVQAFLDGTIAFMDISRTVAQTLERCSLHDPDSLQAVLEADREARAVARESIAQQVSRHG